MHQLTKTSRQYEIVSHHVFAVIKRDMLTGQQTLFSTQVFEKDTTICSFSASSILETPSYLTIQINKKKHLLLNPRFLQYINHGCTPNCFFDVSHFQLVALRKIEAHEEFTFFYPSTEWEMANVFMCTCQQPNCLGLISGAAQIPDELLKKYRLSSYIKNKIRYRKLKRA